MTLCINDNIKCLENVKQGFKRTISWNKYRSDIITQTKNNNLDYLIDLNLGTLTDCLYFHSKMVAMILQGILNKHCMPLLEIKDFNALIDNK